MREPSYEAGKLLICIFHFLGQKAKDRFGDYKSGGNLDSALYRMVKEKLFPDWFCEEFACYDPLYGILHGLEYIILHALRGGSMRLVLTGGNNKYRFPMSEKECAGRLNELPVSVEQTRQWALTLQQYLSESEKK